VLLPSVINRDRTRVAANISAFLAKDTIQRAMDQAACHDCMTERCARNACGPENLAIQLWYKIAGQWMSFATARLVTQCGGRYGEFSMPGSGENGGLGWADLVNSSAPTQVQVTEIKHGQPSAADVAQVTRYTTQGRAVCDPARIWVPGTDFPPMPDFVVPS